MLFLQKPPSDTSSRHSGLIREILALKARKNFRVVAGSEIKGIDDDVTEKGGSCTDFTAVAEEDKLDVTL